MSPDSASTETQKATAPDLTGAQRRHLRSLAHPLRPVVLVGEAGLSEAVLKALDDALTSHELVKVRLRQPENKKEAARALGLPPGLPVCVAGADTQCALLGSGARLAGELPLCTRCHPEWLWSYRRDGPGAGRIETFLWRE